MSTAATTANNIRRRRRLRTVIIETGSAVLGLALLIWTLLPVYNMLLSALAPDEGKTEFALLIYPPEPSLDSFKAVLTQDC